MSEILSDLEFLTFEHLTRTIGLTAQEVIRLISSHRALQAERDAYKAAVTDEMAENMKLFEMLGVHEDIKAGTSGTEVVIKAVTSLKQERDALKAELAKAKKLIDEAQIIVGGNAPEYTIWLDAAKQWMEKA